MKVTKYPQSCLILEENKRRILIDPGSFVTEKYAANDLGRIDGILITHKHSDHADDDLIHALADGTFPVIGNAQTKEALGDVVTEVVEDGQSFTVGGFSVVARELPHVAMIDGTPGPQNTGYVINDTFFHPGDGIEIADLTVDTLAVPIAGPDISPRDVFAFIEHVGCKQVIPIHYDYFTQDPHVLEERAKMTHEGVRFIVLRNGESTNV